MVLYTSSVVLIALGWILHHQKTEGCVSRPWEHGLVNEDILCFHCPSGHYLECDQWALEDGIVEPAFRQACGIKIDFCNIGPTHRRKYVHLGPWAVDELHLTPEVFFKLDNCGLADVDIGIYPHHQIDHIDLHLQNNQIVDLGNIYLGKSSHLRTLNLSGNLLETLSSDFNEPFIQVADFSYNSLQLVETGSFSRFEILRWLSLANNNLTAVPKLNLENTSQITLILKGNAISIIEDNAFENVMFDMLDLSDNFLTNITRGMFSTVEKVTTLKLGNNLISALEPGCFVETGVSILDLSDNSLVTVSPDVFSYLRDLTSLVLSNNKLESIGTRGEFGFPRLELLDLSHNLLRSVPSFERFAHSDELRRLILSFNRIVVEVNNLRYWSLDLLDLSGNPIHTLDGAVFKRSWIAHLDVSNCELQEFPTDAIRVPNVYGLREANLSSNRINVIENGSLTNSQISVLDLSGNSLTTIPRNVFSDRRALRFLTLSNNQIQSIEGPDVFEKCTWLEHLDLSNNFLVEIPNGTFTGLTSLRRLLLSSNKIVTFGADLFDGLRLTLLDFSNNPIRIIEGTSFRNTNVTHLNISNCDLVEFPLGVVKNLEKSLRAANFSRNRIKTITSLHFDGAIQLESLDLSHNLIDTVHCFRSGGNLQNLHLDNNAISYVERCLFTEIMFSTTGFSLRHNSLDCCELQWLHHITSKAKTLLDADETTCMTHSGEYFWLEAFVSTECGLRSENSTNSTDNNSHANIPEMEHFTGSTDDNSVTIVGVVLGTFFGTIALQAVIALSVCLIRKKRNIKPKANETRRGAQLSTTSVDEVTGYETVEMPNNVPNIYDRLQEQSMTTTEDLHPERNSSSEGDYVNVQKY